MQWKDASVLQAQWVLDKVVDTLIIKIIYQASSVVEATLCNMTGDTNLQLS